MEEFCVCDGILCYGTGYLFMVKMIHLKFPNSKFLRPFEVMNFVDIRICE